VARPSATFAATYANFTNATCCLVPGIARWLGSSGTEVLMGRGWGAFRLAAREEIKFGLRGYA
jgi:hypothetical protein